MFKIYEVGFTEMNDVWFCCDISANNYSSRATMKATALS